MTWNGTHFRIWWGTTEWAGGAQACATNPFDTNTEGNLLIFGATDTLGTWSEALIDKMVIQTKAATTGNEINFTRVADELIPSGDNMIYR